MRTYFDGIDKITCEGPDSNIPLTLRCDDRDRIEMANRHV